MANSAIERYFLDYADRLKSDFERSRALHRDSDVKGSNNEQIVAEFLRQHFPANYVVTNVEILDANNQSCDEIDVCVCNQDQPFSQSPGQLLLAEGVDFVLQVKAILNGSEIPRIRKNAEHLKRLTRTHANRDQVFGKVEDAPYFFNRIPYIVLAFTSQLTLSTVRQKVVSELSGVPLENQPDAIFVLDRGFLINFREGKGFAWRKKGKPLTGWAYGDSADRTLFEMMRHIYKVVPRFSRNVNPLCHYFDNNIPFNVVGEAATESTSAPNNHNITNDG